MQKKNAYLYKGGFLSSSSPCSTWRSCIWTNTTNTSSSRQCITNRHTKKWPTPVNRTAVSPNVEYKIMAKYIFCLVCSSEASWMASATEVRPLIFSIATANPAFVSIQNATSRVRKVLFWSSIVGFSMASLTSILVTARVTVSLNAASTSSWIRWVSSTTGASASLLFDEETDGSASALSLPLVPQETYKVCWTGVYRWVSRLTLCKLQNA